jgi:tetraacyldisaccharide 4'-kinase
MIRIWKGEAPYFRAFLLIPLFALSLVYRAALVARALGYAAGLMAVEKAPAPVISVGNLSLGGTGKTTVVEWLSRHLKERGLCPGIIMLGYKKKRRGAFAVDPRHDTAEGAGDEAVMLARRTMLPVLVGKQRGESVRRAVRDFGIDVAIFDDGYQVRNVRKNVELLILNGPEPRAALHLFPLGLLREPLEMMKKADILLINKGEPGTRMRALAAGMPCFRIRYRPLHLCRLRDRTMIDHQSVRGKKVLAFSGLGDNGSFFNLLREIGADVVATLEFPDHYRYRREDLRRIESFHGADLVVTTEKDAVKMEGMDPGDNVFYLSIEAEIEDQDRLVELVISKMRE